MDLQEIFWDREDGAFRRVNWDSEKKEYDESTENIDPRRVEPIGETGDVRGNNRTVGEIVDCIHEMYLHDFPDVEVYKRINAFSLNSHWRPERDHKFGKEEAVNVSFYCLHE